VYTYPKLKNIKNIKNIGTALKFSVTPTEVLKLKAEAGPDLNQTPSDEDVRYIKAVP
jgi:hypothetical protein